MLTYSKSTMRVRRIPMHLSSGHVTFIPGKFYPPPLIFSSRTWGARRTHVGLCPKFLVYFLFPRKISEMRGPTGVKFCTMVSNGSHFIIPLQNFGGAPQKNFRGEKHAKFGPISDDFEVRWRISPKRMKVFKIG